MAVYLLNKMVYLVNTRVSYGIGKQRAVCFYERWFHEFEVGHLIGSLIARNFTSKYKKSLLQ